MLTQAELKQLIKESVREVLKEERLGLYELLIPYVSNEEMKEIKEKYGIPSNYDENEFVDMTEWVME